MENCLDLAIRTEGAAGSTAPAQTNPVSLLAMMAHLIFHSIDVLRELNPHAQLFITTHSPSVLSKGRGDKITYMEDITM